MPSIYLGTGGYEGGIELAGKLKPLLYGYCNRIKPICLDHDLALYQVNDGPIYDILAVYDSGWERMQLLDCKDLLSWVPDGLERSILGYRVDTSKGVFRLAYNPKGIITVDCVGSTTESYHGLTEGGYAI